MPVRIVTLAGLACVLWGALAGSARGQGEGPRPPRVRTQFNQARELFKRGDYESAAVYYAQAQAGKSELTANERADLTTQIAQNNTALQGRRDGASQVRQAQDAVAMGRLKEAANLVKGLETNQYLAVEDKQTVAILNQRVRATVDTQAAGSDYRTLLTRSRSAMERGDYELAETLANQADKLGTTFPTWMHPWSDSPAKVRREAQAARAKATTGPALPPPTPPDRKEPASSNPFQTVKNFVIGKDPKVEDKAPPPPVFPEGNKSSAAKTMKYPPVTIPDLPKENKLVTMPKPPEIKPVKLTVPEPRPAPTGNARQLVKDGYKALEAGDFLTAQRLAAQAKQIKADFDWREENPDRLLAEIQRRQQGKADNPKQKSLGADEARGLVRQGRALLQQEKIDEADKLCTRAAGCTTARWGLFEDSPDKLRGDLAKARGKRDREESVRLMVEARKLYGAGNLQEAKTRAWRAQQLYRGPYGLFDVGERPDNLLKDIHRAELAKKGNAPPLPLDFAKTNDQAGPARPPLDLVKNNPKLNDKGIPAPPPLPGNIPFAKVKPKDGDPQGPPVLPSLNPPAVNNPLVSAPAQAAAKARAVALLREARELEGRWFLGEARAKALEAAQLKAPFAPDEDSPEYCLISLSSKCDARVKQLVLQAANQAFNTPTDPNRFQKALSDLGAAKKLAQSFGLDTHRIEQEAVRMQQAAAASGINLVGDNHWAGDATVANAGGPEAQKNRQLGLEKLDQARREINHGGYGLARKFAEEATHPQYGVQQEALAVIASLDVEEFNQRKLTAHRNAESGFDAFRRGAFQQAASIFGAIDLALLAPDRARRIGELMSTKEMQAATTPGQLIRVDVKEAVPGSKPGTATVGDLVAPGEDLTTQFRALEEIQFQALRERGLTAQRTAIQRMKNGDTQGAVEVLRDFLAQLDQTLLDPERKNLLKRPVDNRLQQVRTIQAQKILEKNSDLALGNQHNENRYQADISKVQTEVADQLKQFRQLYKEGKYHQAFAAAKRAKEIDPDNVAADAAIQMSQIAENQQKWDEDRLKNGDRLNEELRHDFGDYVNMKKPLSFNEDIWMRARMREGKNGFYTSPHRNPTERQIESLLLKSTGFSFKDEPLQSVIDTLQSMSGINIVIDRPALNDAGISLDMPLTMSLEKISLKSGLNLLLDQARLTWVIDNEVIKITTPERSRGRMKQIVYSVADLVIPVENHPLSPVNNMTEVLKRHIDHSSPGIQAPTPYLPPTGLGVGQQVSSSSSGSYHGSGGLGSAMSQGNNGQVNKTGPGNTIEGMLINMIENTVQPTTWSHMGGPGVIQYFPLGHALIVNQTQEVQEEVLALLQSLRRLQDLEVAIEVKLVQVADSFFERIGVDFDLNILTPKTRFENQLLTNNFQPPGFINRFRPDRFVAGTTPAGTFTSDLNVPIKGSSFDFSVPPFGNFPGSIGNDGGISLGLAFLSDIQVFMFMEAAQGNRRVNFMQAPKITVFNGQTANIFVQDQIFFLLSATPTYFGNTLAFVPQNIPFPIGFALQVNPVVSADRRFVRMNLQPQITGIATGGAVPLIPFQATIPQVFEGGQLGQPVFFQMFFQQPQLSTISINTTVNVPDGGTVLLGGLKVVAEGRSEFGAPLLGKIPYLSRLFRNVAYGREAQSLMIMVTPRIIINEEEEQIFLGNIPAIPRP